MLDEKAREPLDRPEDRAMHHQGAVRLVVRARVLEVEALRQRVIELDGRALPLAADRVVELDVDLRPVERAAANVHPIGQATPLERVFQCLFGNVPHGVRAELLVGASGQIEPILQSESLTHYQLDDVEQVEDLLLDLVLAQEDVRIVHREPTHAQHAMQRPRALVAIHIRDLGEPNRQIAVAALLARVDEDVHGTVHRLDAIAHVFRLALAGRHRWKLIRSVEGQMSGTEEQLLARDMGRVDELIAAREDHILDEAAQLEVQDGAFGMPQNQPGPDVFLDREEIPLPADDAVIALTRLFEPRDVPLEVLLGEPRSAVNALQHLAALIAAPIRAGGVQQLEMLDLAGAGNVRAAAQVHERAVRVHRDDLILLEVIDSLELEWIVLEAPLRLFSTHLFTRERIIGFHNLAHLPFDRRDILGRERPTDIEVVIKTVFDRRAEADLRLRE